MAIPGKRRGGSGGPPRTKGNGRLKERHFLKEDPRDDRLSSNRKTRNGSGGRRARSTSPTTDFSKRRRLLDPTLLARGMTSRCVGARVQLSVLTPDEVERDLRHMEAYANACVAYAQQFFIFQNRSLVQNGHYGPVSTPTLVSTDHFVNGDAYSYDPYRPQRLMPVRIDPEEEKRISMLRKRIAMSEAQREVLETEYMSLRAHYVHESHKLRRTRQAVEGQLKLLQELVKKRGRVVALRRVRCAVARDILKTLEHRNSLLTDSGGTKSSLKVPLIAEAEKVDILDVWNDVENQLREAEKSCRNTTLPEELVNLKNDKRFKAVGKTGVKEEKRKQPPKSDADDDNDDVVWWEARTMPRTPYGLPVLLSLMSEVPDRAAAFGCSGLFGSNESSLCFLEQNLPESFETMPGELDELARLNLEAESLEKELSGERVSNSNLQRQIIAKRKRYDEMCAMMTLLRGETEAVLMRHNVLLDTPEARSAAQDIHNKEREEREQRGEPAGGSESTSNEHPNGSANESHHRKMDGGSKKRESIRREEHDHDGDDEGEAEEEEEEDGEILHPMPPSEVLVGSANDVASLAQSSTAV